MSISATLSEVRVVEAKKRRTLEESILYDINLTLTFQNNGRTIPVSVGWVTGRYDLAKEHFSFTGGGTSKIFSKISAEGVNHEENNPLTAIKEAVLGHLRKNPRLNPDPDETDEITETEFA